jgi:HAD superfamily hydrolase (TIGR01509 family)
MAQKAFIFDLDGVIINSEPEWEKQKPAIYKKVFGESIASKLGSTLGINVDDIYEMAKKLGTSVDKQKLRGALLQAALAIYDKAPITADLDKLVDVLVTKHYDIAIVSASPQEWIDQVMKRLRFKQLIRLSVSIYAKNDIKSKPAPDGYLYAIEQLGATPQTTIILEDSNPGIASAKASGAFTIAFKESLVDGYKQIPGDISANNIKDVIKIVQTR